MSCLCILGILLTACAPATPPGIPDMPPCTPTAPNVNIYKATPQSWTRVIFQLAATPLPPSTSPQDQQIQQAQNAAFDLLVNQVKRWSAIDNIVLSPTKEVRITVTLISPELIQAAYLNDILFRRMLFSDPDESAKKILDGIAERDELLFLVTITTIKYDETATGENLITLNFPVNEMTLTNAANLPVSPDHVDHGLGQSIRITQGPVSGYVAYPLAVLSGDQCIWVLNPEFNQNINISVPSLIVNNIDQGPQTWTIKYVPLLNVDVPPPLPNINPPPGFTPTLVSPAPLPPSPVFNEPVTDSVYWDSYWQSMARYIWGQITLTETPKNLAEK